MNRKVIYTKFVEASCTSRLCSESLWVFFFFDLGRYCPFERGSKDERVRFL